MPNSQAGRAGNDPFKQKNTQNRKIFITQNFIK